MTYQGRICIKKFLRRQAHQNITTYLLTQYHSLHKYIFITQEVLDKSQARINESIKRVAKKKFKDDTAAGEKFVGESIANLNIATNPGPIFL